MLVTIALVLVVYTASGLFFSQIGAHGEIEWQAVRLFLEKTALSLPLWLGMLGMLNLLAFAFRSNTLSDLAQCYCFPSWPVLGLMRAWCLSSARL